MANDCLVTKLKGVVNNDNLLKVGEIRLNVAWNDTSAANASFYIRSSENVTVKVNGTGIGGNPGALNSNTYLLNANATARLYITNDVTEVFVDNKYSLVIISVANNLNISTTVDDIKYSNIGDLGNIGLAGDIGDLAALASLVKLNVFGDNLYGNIERLSNHVFSQFDVSSLLITGNINNMVDAFKNINRLNFGVSPNITGDLVTFANTINVTRKTGEMIVNTAYTGITWDGYNPSISNWPKIIFSDSGVTITQNY